MNYTWNFNALIQNLPFILTGLINTLQIALIAMGLGLVFGALMALMRNSRILPLRLLIAAIIAVIRNTPPLVQLLWLFYALPILTGIQIGHYMAAIIAFSLYASVFLCEIFRSGIAAVDRGQWEAAAAIGMRRHQQLSLIITPQMLPKMLPALVSQAIDIVKLTSIAALLPFAEFVYSVKIVADQSYRPLEAYTALALGFAVLLLPVVGFAIWLERRLNRVRR